MPASAGGAVMIEQSIRIHDRHQVEIKLAYELDDFERAKSYDISLFFFLPASLGITPATYSKGNFYNDLIGRMRIKTPVFLLRDMASGPDNPLKKLETVFVSLARHADKGTEIEYERQLKMFCCILKSALRDHIVVLASRPVATDQKDLVEQFLSYVEDTIKRFRALRTIINVPTIGRESFSKYLFADEFVGMLVESYVYEMLEVLKRRASGAFQTYQARLLTLVEDEIAHRRANGYPSIPNAATDNEVLVFRKSVLKKYVESALFLTTRTKREGSFTEQTIFAVAAGLSMVFATAVAFFVQRRYGTMTFPLFVAIILSYMFKDRLKELLRMSLSSRARRLFFDRRQQIFNGASMTEQIGTCRESFDFVKDSYLPTSVRRLRNRDHLTEIENGWMGETVFHYRKHISLLPKWFKRAQSEYRVVGVNDVLRLDISKFLSRMDEPKKTLWLSTGAEYREISGQRVYHINMISRCCSGKSLDERRFRIVLNKEGIKRIEMVNAQHMTFGHVGVGEGAQYPLIGEED
jgi:hypothetical protein